MVLFSKESDLSSLSRCGPRWRMSTQLTHRCTLLITKSHGLYVMARYDCGTEGVHIPMWDMQQIWGETTKESLLSHEISDRPWEKFGIDLYTIDGQDYLIMVDYFSNFWDIDHLQDTKVSTVMKKLKCHFGRHCNKWQWSTICLWEIQQLCQRTGFWAPTRESGESTDKW